MAILLLDDARFAAAITLVIGSATLFSTGAAVAAATARQSPASEDVADIFS